MATEKEPDVQPHDGPGTDQPTEQPTSAHTLAPSSGFWKYQAQAYAFYHTKVVELGVAGLIVFNFIVGCFNRQIDPTSEKYKDVWDIFEDFFNIAFLTELLLNMYGSWMKPFFRSSWNRFDLIVVSIGCLDLIRLNLPGPLKLVRLLRAFRVFRLFGRVESLKKTLEMIERAVPGVLSAFLIAVIMLCIYSVLATDFFKEVYDDCHEPSQVDPVARSARGNCFGYEYYGNFLKSLYTLFQILTGESWSEAAVRPVLQYYQSSLAELAGVAVFFLSFIMINGIVIVNVVVAFLIDGMHAEPEKPQEEDNQGENERVASAEDLWHIHSELNAVRQKLDDHRAELQTQFRRIREQVEADQNNGVHTSTL